MRTPPTDPTPAETQQWAKPPAPGKQCRFSGLGRSSTYRLIARSKGAIRTVSLKEPGTKRGTRLFSVPDLLVYLDRLAADQRQQEAAT